jgi:hypothetical protein
MSGSLATQRSASQQFTTSLLADGNQTYTANKRKRSGVPTVASNEGVEELSVALNVANQTPYTPNPKAKKQIKHRGRTISTLSQSSPTRTVFPSSQQLELQTPPRKAASTSPAKRTPLQSPHATNPNADFLLPVPSLTQKHISAARRRSATPIPPYEPPVVKFSSPKEVVLSPASVSINKGSKKKVVPKKEIKIMIKTEPPEIDLTKPMPPPSPTDDPLLLSGPPVRRSRSLFGNPPRNGDIVRRPQSSATHLSPALTSSSSPVSRTIGPILSNSFNPNFPDTTDFSMDDTDIHLPIFDLSNIPSSAGCTSDDDDDLEEHGEGEYTGRYTVMKVPTKVDPPTSGTRDRAEKWGRPISPFPKISALVEGGSDEVEMRLDANDWRKIGNIVGSRGVQGGDDMVGRTIPSDFEASANDTNEPPLGTKGLDPVPHDSAKVGFQPSSSDCEEDADYDMDGPFEDENDRENESGACMGHEDQDDSEERDMSIRVHSGDDSLEDPSTDDDCHSNVVQDIIVDSAGLWEPPTEIDTLGHYAHDHAALNDGRIIESPPKVDEISCQNNPIEKGKDESDEAFHHQLNCEAESVGGSDCDELDDHLEIFRKSTSHLRPHRDSPFGGEVPVAQRFPNNPLFPASRDSTSLQSNREPCYGQDGTQVVHSDEEIIALSHSSVSSGSSQDGEGDVDASVVQITSDDPRAAARAAAILKMVRELYFLSLLADGFFFRAARLRLATAHLSKEMPLLAWQRG